MHSEEQLQALRDALANGVRRVRFENREIEYRSIEELKAAIAAAEADVAKAIGTGIKPQSLHPDARLKERIQEFRRRRARRLRPKSGGSTDCS